MGSFAFTCCISGLPIGYYEPVRYMLLTENVYHKPAEHTCYIYDRWLPRTFPIKACYNNYGSIQDAQEGPALDIILEGFEFDLIERGVGDNSYHDVPVRKDMGFSDILTALWEGRVMVSTKGEENFHKKAYNPGALPKQHLLHPGIPTASRVRKLLEANFKVSDGRFAGGYLVNLVRKGLVRVRWEGGSGDEEVSRLQVAANLLGEGFSTMVTAGTGAYADSAELLVAPKALPHGQRYHYVLGEKGTKKHAHVAQTMIREDVWQSLCEIPLVNEYGTKISTVQTFRNAAQEMWDGYQDALGRVKAGGSPLSAYLLLDSIARKNPACLPQDIFCLGPMTHFQLMAMRKPIPSQRREFLNTVAELAFIQQVLSRVRYQWRPSDGSGPQFGDWAMHHNVLNRLTEIANKKAAQQAFEIEESGEGQ